MLNTSVHHNKSSITDALEGEVLDISIIKNSYPLHYCLIDVTANIRFRVVIQFVIQVSFVLKFDCLWKACFSFKIRLDT